jgi:hypothetical protein
LEGNKMNERRSEPRFLCADLVKVRIEDADGARAVSANLEDISASGACIQLEAAARAGADVEVICGKCRLKGKVAYCRHSALGYDVGVAFNEKGSWNRKRFTPKHLLKMPTVMQAARQAPLTCSAAS